MTSRLVRLSGWPAAVLAVACLALAPPPAAAQIQTLSVTLESRLTVPDYDPWVADVWGYEAAGRAYALVCKGNGLLVVDVTDPAQPLVASTVPALGTDLKDAKTFGHHAYCVNQSGNFQVIDLTDPYAAVTVGEIAISQGSHNCYIETSRGLLFVCGHSVDEAFVVYDLNVDPVNPPRVAGYGSYYSHDIHVRGGLALVCAIGDGFFELVDVGDLGAMSRVSTFTHPSPAPHSGWFSDDLRYLLTADEIEDGHLIIWDIQDPSQPFPVQIYQSGVGTSIHNVHVEGNLAYVAYYSEGVRIIDLSDPPNAQELGYIDSPDFDENGCFAHPFYRGVWGVYPHTTAGNFYFATMCEGGLYVARFDPGSTAVEERGTMGVRNVALLPNQPNPFPRSTLIPFALADPGEVRLRVFDLEGRVVATLAEGTHSVGTHRVRWDGRNTIGQEVGPGVYFLRLVGPGVDESRRLVLAR
jgi:choice-of-anchor B domain-containing protein